MGNVHRLKEHLFPHTSLHTIQEVPVFLCQKSILPIQSTTLWSVHNIHEIHSGGQGDKTDGFTQRFKDPPVPRQLVGKS